MPQFGVSDFKKLSVWQKAYALAIDAHRVASGIRGAEYLSLKSQIIRAASSIPANIVEGRAQPSSKSFSRYLTIAVNSASELEFHLIMAKDIGVITMKDYVVLLTNLIEVRKMLYGLLNHLRLTSVPTP